MRRSATLKRPEAGTQLGQRERLGHVIVGAAVEAGHAIVYRILRGEDQDGECCLAGANVAEHLKARSTRQHQVENHRVVIDCACLIAGLGALRKPYAHLHTQFNRDLPWGTIDMDFMNLNQAAHGDREFGFICSRLRLSRKVVVGHYEDEEVHARLETWMRAACAWAAIWVAFADS